MRRAGVQRTPPVRRQRPAPLTGFRTLLWAWLTAFACSAPWAAPAATGIGPALDAFTCAAAASIPDSPLRSGVLSRGVNMTDVLKPGIPLAQAEQDVQAVRRSGLRHVRLPISPSWVLSWPSADTPDPALRRLDAVICAALARKLAVILDAHPEDGLALGDGASADVAGRLADAWERLARRYAVVSPGLMVFEALNEPGLTDEGRWRSDQLALLARIRSVAPDHAVLLTAAPASTAAALSRLSPVADQDVGYVFHFYSPLVFTHQGAGWATPDLSSVRSLAYPADAANVREVRRGARPAFGHALSEYEAGYARTAAAGAPGAIRAEVALAAEWAVRHRVPLFVTEFGAYGAADQASRRAWMHDVRTVMEANGIGWTVWEYRGGFGIADDLAAPCRRNASTRRALGLC